jgi:hypothetical protein
LFVEVPRTSKFEAGFEKSLADRGFERSIAREEAKTNLIARTARQTTDVKALIDAEIAGELGGTIGQSVKAGRGGRFIGYVLGGSFEGAFANTQQQLKDGRPQDFSFKELGISSAIGAGTATAFGSLSELGKSGGGGNVDPTTVRGVIGQGTERLGKIIDLPESPGDRAFNILTSRTGGNLPIVSTDIQGVLNIFNTGSPVTQSPAPLTQNFQRTERPFNTYLANQNNVLNDNTTPNTIIGTTNNFFSSSTNQQNTFNTFSTSTSTSTTSSSTNVITVAGPLLPILPIFGGTVGASPKKKKKGKKGKRKAGTPASLIGIQFNLGTKTRAGQLYSGLGIRR